MFAYCFYRAFLSDICVNPKMKQMYYQYLQYEYIYIPNNHILLYLDTAVQEEKLNFCGMCVLSAGMCLTMVQESTDLYANASC